MLLHNRQSQHDSLLLPLRASKTDKAAKQKMFIYTYKEHCESSQLASLSPMPLEFARNPVAVNFATKYSRLDCSRACFENFFNIFKKKQVESVKELSMYN